MQLPAAVAELAYGLDERGPGSIQTPCETCARMVLLGPNQARVFRESKAQAFCYFCAAHILNQLDADTTYINSSKLRILRIDDGPR